MRADEAPPRPRTVPKWVVEGLVRTFRESWRNDGAEGESVHLLCDVLEGKVVVTEDPRP